MRHFFSVKLAALLLLLLPPPSLAQMPQMAAHMPQITVTGQGEVQAAPDFVEITLGVREEAKTAKAAFAGVSSKMQGLWAVLDGFGLPEEARQTTRITLSPLYSDSRSSIGRYQRELTGFSAQNELRIRLDAIDSLGPLLDALAQNGVTDLSRITFGLDDPQAALDEARVLAVRDARAKAALYAEAAELALGAILSIDESGGGQAAPMPMLRMEMASDMAPMPIAEGRLSFSASVQLRFGITAP